MIYQHQDLAAGRWAKMPFVEQMANIGSEVERALTWRTKQREDFCQRAFDRALELIDLTLETRCGGSRLREVARVREALVDYFSGANEFGSTEKSWKRYFFHFAYAARKDH